MSDKDQGGKPPVADDPDLAARLRSLDRKLDEHRRANEEPDPRPKQGAALAMRLAADFVAGILLGAALGWGFDRLLGTSPWGLMVFLLLGFAAGILSILRTAGLVKPGPAGPDELGDRI